MRVSKSYENWEYDFNKAFEKNGKPYVKAKTICPRCSGKGIIISRVENGRPIPVQPDAGICYQCQGKKTLTKEIRVYTDEEFEKKEAAAERARAKKKEEQEKRMKAEAALKKAKWLETHGFNEEGDTYIYFPCDSFNVKDTLKQDGFRFEPVLLWHAPQVPAGYEDKVIKINISSIAEPSAWGEYHYLSDAKSKVNDTIKQALPPVHSSWLGEVGERVKNVKATVLSIRGFEGYYGYVRIITFSIDNNLAKWFCSTSKFQNEPGDEVILTGTIKDNIEDKYEDGAEVSILTRCKVVEEVA